MFVLPAMRLCTYQMESNKDGKAYNQEIKLRYFYEKRFYQKPVIKILKSVIACFKKW